MINYPRLYEYRFQGVDPEKKALVWREIANYIFSVLNRPNRLLDPAGGMLEFIKHVPAKEKWVVDVVDYRGEENIEGLNYQVSDIFNANLPKNYFDGIFISNFLEHLATPNDIGRFLRVMYESTAKGGKIAIMGPNFKYSSKNYFDFADHILPLSHFAVAEHLYAVGYNIDKVIPKFIPFSFRGVLPPSPFLTRMYLKMPFAWPIFGKQFLILGEKT